jgi:nucleoside-diphosphate-sugar epimerase
MNKKILVAGGGGFIGGHLVKHFLDNGDFVRVVDYKPFDEWYQQFDSAENHLLNLEEKDFCYQSVNEMDEVYNLACNMGGMGFIENNKALCMQSILINTHLLMAARDIGVDKFFYSSSACVYNASKQTSVDVVALKEEDAYPADAEDGYGWEKLFSERMCRHFREDHSVNTFVARFHNVYGPEGTWNGGREKAPAAICRKVGKAYLDGLEEIEVWGDGQQTRSFMYVDDCITGINKLMNSDFHEPINLGRDDLITINQLIDLAERFAGVKLKRNYDLSAPQGVRGRNSDNTLIKEVLEWEPSITMEDGLRKTYDWILDQMTSQV